MTIEIEGLEPIVDEFDVLLVDQYGVLHNGVHPYSYAVETLEKLKQSGKHVVIVSNSGKRASVNIGRIVQLGFGEQLFDQFVSSGELAFRYLRSELSDVSIQNCFLISRDNDFSAIENLNLSRVDSPDEADMILISGCQPELHEENDYRQLLKHAAERGTTCLCTNPDKKNVDNGWAAVWCRPNCRNL